MKIRMRQLVVGAALMGAAAAGSAVAASAITGDTGVTDTTVIETPVTEAPAVTTPATGNTGSATPATPDTDDDGDGHEGRHGRHGGRGGHGRHGSPEEALTGDIATKVEAAAKAAVPGATVERLEKDADGTAPYEAHMEKADGTHVTVYVNADFTVKSIEEGRPGCDDKDHGQDDSSNGTTGTQSAASSSTAQV